MKLLAKVRRRMSKSSVLAGCHPDRAPDDWPPRLRRLHTAATSALEVLRRSSPQALSDRERAEHDDQLKMMQAMADPKKTATVYFAMAEAMRTHAGRPLSDRDFVTAQEICQALGQESLSDAEREAIERLARKRHE